MQRILDLLTKSCLDRLADVLLMVVPGICIGYEPSGPYFLLHDVRNHLASTISRALKHTQYSNSMFLSYAITN